MWSSVSRARPCWPWTSCPRVRGPADRRASRLAVRLSLHAFATGLRPGCTRARTAADLRDRDGAPMSGVYGGCVNPRPLEGQRMGTITTSDGTEIFFKDWGAGQPIVFSHGWPLSGDDWDTQLMYFVLNGYRVIAHDRRGHGRSTQTSDGHDMDHYADDLAAVTAHLDLHDAVHVGHSTGG